MTRLEVGPGQLADYYEWFRLARNGETLVYHEGDLAFDRLPASFSMEVGGEPPATPLSIMANRIQADAKEGFLRLTQRRMAESRYEYRATRVRHSFEPSPPTEATGADPVPA